jgi:hypothetical protein
VALFIDISLEFTTVRYVLVDLNARLPAVHLFAMALRERGLS